MNSTVVTLITPPERTPSATWQRVTSSKPLALVWTAMRVWLGAMWIQAGTAKLWGNESAGFMHHNGAAVAGFATHGTAAYSWWHSFLTGVVVPNSGTIGVLVAIGEFTIGIALVAGLFTRLAALASLVLLFTYVMSGTASVCAFYALFAVVVIATWRMSSWIGADGAIATYRQHHHGHLVQRHHGISGVAATPRAA
jgi:thiosulfate dehydrogenase [quinone] large subunit